MKNLTVGEIVALYEEDGTIFVLNDGKISEVEDEN